MEATYLAWQTSSGEDCTRLGNLHGLELPQDLERGVSRAEGYPDGVFFDVPAEGSDPLRLADALPNADGMLVVSRGLKQFLETRRPGAVEFLPVGVRGAHGPLGGEYFVVNPLEVVDCLDLQGADVQWSPMDPDCICGCRGVRVDPARIDPSVRLFRPCHLPGVVLVRRDLADELREAGFSGIRFAEPGEAAPALPERRSGGDRVPALVELGELGFED